MKRLFDDFSPISTEKWEEQIKTDLKGADYDKKLIWNTVDGIKVRPYYREEDVINKDFLLSEPGNFPFVRGNRTDNNKWEIRQDFIVKDPAKVNKNIIDVIKRGATSIGLKLCLKDIDQKEKFFSIIKGINFEEIPVHFRGGKGTPLFLDYLISYVKEKKIDKNKVKGSFSYDPLGHLSHKGSFYNNENDDFTVLKELIFKAKTELPGFRIIGINGSNFLNAGSSTTQEIAYSLAIGSEYLDKLTSMNCQIDDIAKSVILTLGIGSNYFMEIAKLRAIRLLWARIVEAYQPEDIKSADILIHSDTISWNKTIYDPYVNMLRLTTEAMSASIGGANSITVHPFDSCYADESEFSSRIARNLQVILKEEAYFNKIADPGAGSYYIENLTESIIDEVWKLFLEVEDKQGYIKAFKEGFIQSAIKEVTRNRKNRVSTRKDIVLGTNQYPDNNEFIADNIDEQIAFPQFTDCGNRVAEPLIISRASVEYEKLRLRTEHHVKRPKVFLLSIGNLTMRKARATFASNFFACAGYEIIDNIGFKNIQDGCKAALEANADVVVVCSSDDEYPEFVPDIFNELQNKTLIVIAGAPVCMDELKSLGIQHFIHIKSNVLETLQNFHDILKIK